LGRALQRVGVSCEVEIVGKKIKKKNAHIYYVRLAREELRMEDWGTDFFVVGGGEHDREGKREKSAPQGEKIGGNRKRRNHSRGGIIINEASSSLVFNAGSTVQWTAVEGLHAKGDLTRKEASRSTADERGGLIGTVKKKARYLRRKTGPKEGRN